jgi:organic hydroperoxide reductase OsmC/OhrA
VAEYKSVVVWSRDGAAFTGGRYSRGHRWLFDGGLEVPASSSPHIVPHPFSIAAAVDPEEAFVASLSSCHMLWFLSIADKRSFVVESYRDEAIGLMGKDASGRLAMTRVTLRPEVRFGGDNRPSADEVAAMHDEAHEQCFIARSVKTDVCCEPVRETRSGHVPH